MRGQKIKKVKKDKWFLEEYKQKIEGEECAIFKIVDSNYNIIGQFVADKENYDELKQIVLLLTSAPELLGTLEYIKENWFDEVYPEEHFDGSSGDEGPKKIVKIRNKINRVIKKAKGELDESTS